MKKLFKILTAIFTLVFCFSGCGSDSNEGITENTGESSFTKNEDGYYQITPKEAHEIMLTESDYIILDVREETEYKEGHIHSAVLLPDYEVIERASEVLPDKDKMILVYCRSGRRSKNASAELAALGYNNVYEFGGIIDWPYDIVTDGETPQAN
ncbi:MAG: rhodanese-like domain-containing protein [Clostridia bacterium]|nr:rhodanese-like domain-containing protein [Clostridia bacterium]